MRDLLRCVLGLGLAAAICGCQGLKPSLENATYDESLKYDSDRQRWTTEPGVSVPVWNSSGLPEQPKQLTPDRGQP